MTDAAIARILKIAKECGVRAELDESADAVILHCDWYNDASGEAGVDVVRVTSVGQALTELGF